MTKNTEIENVKVDWAPVLESQISDYEEKFPDRGIRETFQGIIDDLNANRIKSRLILSGKEPAGYAYYLLPGTMSDRILGNLGFVDKKYSTDGRCENLMKWLLQEGKSQGRMIMLNEVFNGGPSAGKLLDELGFQRMEREMMEISLREVSETPVQVPDGYEISDLSSLNIGEYLEAQSSAYKGSEDELLFSTRDEEKKETAKSIFEGNYGEIIGGVSRVARFKGKLVGSCLVTAGKERAPSEGYPLIIDVFVASEHRGQGIAKALLQDVIIRAKVAGYMNLYLWVNLRSNAKKLYESMGFRDSDFPREIIYHYGFR